MLWEWEGPQESGPWDLSGEGDRVRFPTLTMVFAEIAQGTKEYQVDSLSSCTGRPHKA